MSEERKTLLESLKDRVIYFKERETVGRMKTEHSVFIPTALMKDQAEETKEFILAAREVNNRKELVCPIVAEPKETGRFTGIEFVFDFSEKTDFDGIVALIDEKLVKE